MTVSTRVSMTVSRRVIRYRPLRHALQRYIAPTTIDALIALLHGTVDVVRAEIGESQHSQHFHLILLYIQAFLKSA